MQHYEQRGDTSQLERHAVSFVVEQFRSAGQIDVLIEEGMQVICGVLDRELTAESDAGKAMALTIGATLRAVRARVNHLDDIEIQRHRVHNSVP